MIQNATAHSQEKPTSLDLALARRAEQLLRQFAPTGATCTLTLKEHLQTKNTYLHIDISPVAQEPLPPEPKLKALAHALALQMGLRVELTVRPTSSPSFSILAERTVHAITLEKPLVNVYQDLPADMLSRLLSANLIRSISPSQPSGTSSSLEGMRETLKQLLGPNTSKVIDRGGFIQVALTEESSILLEPDFYALTASLSDKAPRGKDIVVTLLTATSQLTTSDEAHKLALPAPLPIDIEDEEIDLRAAHIERNVSIVQETLLSLLGTHHPLTVDYNESADTVVVSVLTHNLRAANLKDIEKKVEQALGQLGISHSIRRELLDSTSLMINLGKRDRASIDDIDDMAGLAGKLLRSNADNPWAAISMNGNCIEIEPKLSVPPLLRQAIREKLALIPAPIVIRQPKQSSDFVTRAELLAMVKLMLPPSACVKDISGDPSNHRFSLTIQCSSKEWNLLKPHVKALSQAAESLNQEIVFKSKIIDLKVAECLERVSDRHRKVIAKHMLPHGAIPIASWEPLERKPLVDPTAVVERLKASNSSFKDWTDKPCFSIDPAGTSLVEDCLSVELDDARDEVTVGVHLICAPSMIYTFSVRRFKAYERGDTIYTQSAIRGTSKMFPELDTLGFTENSARPAISVSFTVPRQSLENPDIVAKSLAAACIDLTFVTNRRRMVYPSSLQNINELTPPRELRQALAVIDQVAASITRGDALPELRSIRSHQPGFGDRITTLLRAASSAVAQEVSAAGLPCSYHLFKKPSEQQLRNMQAAIQSNLSELPHLAPFVATPAADLLNDNALLVSLMTQVRALGSKFDSIKDYSGVQEVLSLDIRQPGLMTVLSAAVKNPPLRSLSAFITQHQLLASRGVLAPLSIGEVRILLERIRRQENEAAQVRHELELFEAFNTLQTATEPLQAQVTTKRPDALPSLKPLYISNLPAGCVLNETPQTLARQGIILRDGDIITVTPLQYNLVRRSFVFKLAEPRPEV